MPKLNILHHKSWHVYKRENRERVWKDEEEHRNKLDKEKEKKDLEQRNSRLEQLRVNSTGVCEEFSLFPQQASSTPKLNINAVKVKEDPWYLSKNTQTLQNTRNDVEKSRLDPINLIKSDYDSSAKSTKVVGKVGKQRTIEDMRRIRLEREQREASKTKKLFTKPEQNEEFRKHERDQDYYHSQFNREFKKSKRN